jgi:RecA/RadA recombinase
MAKKKKLDIDDDVAVEESKKKGKSKGKSAKEIVDSAIEDARGYSPADDIDDLLDGVEKKYGLSSSLVDRDEKRLSTGLLALDLLLNGGIVGGGWYTIYGGEQSCKSTLTMTLLCMIQNAIDELNRKIAASIFDYEGSTDIEYIGNMMEALGLKSDATTIFGIKDDDTGSWLIKPKIRYYMPDVGEDFYRYQAKLRRALPDVQKIGDKYWYVYEHTQENKKKFSGKYDVKYLTKTNKIRIPAPDGFMQAVSIVDSYPAMLPEGLDDDDRNEAMAEQARMHAAGIKKVRSGMRKKRMTVFGVNQLRLRPAVMHGNPEYEPSGEALKFFCLAPETRIRTELGLVSVEEYYEKFRHSLPKIQGKCGLESPTIFDDTGVDNIIKITTSNGYTLRGKHGHQVLANDQAKSPSNYQFARLDSLTVGKFVLIKPSNEITRPVSSNSDLDYQDAYNTGVKVGLGQLDSLHGVPFNIRTGSSDLVSAYIKGYSSVTNTHRHYQHAVDFQLLLLDSCVFSKLEKVENFYTVSVLDLSCDVDYLTDEIVDIEYQEAEQTYDANMPDTHTIITNGIVSHNSDVRIKSTSRGSAPYGFVLDKGIMEENSVTVEGGKDIYRFICLRTVKNKLGGIPNREVWARVWVTDGDGRARGFDPVFDTFEYLKQLGYVDGTRNNLKFHPDVPLHGAKKLSFEDFKVLVLGSKKQITEVCERVGLKKAGNIRTWCSKHCASGKGPKRYKDQIVKRSKEKIDTDDE